MIKELLRPRWFVFHVLAVLLAIGLVQLGFWQLRRHDQRSSENARIEAMLQHDPTDLVTALDNDDVEHRPVEVSGHYLPFQFRLSPWSRENLPGYDVLTPLLLDDGQVVIVDRGWVPLDHPVPPPPDEHVELVGRIRNSRPARRVLDDSGTVALLSDVDLPQIIDRATSVEEAPPSARFIDDVFIVQTTDANLAIEHPTSFPIANTEEISLSNGNHFSYAMQWFSFAIIGLIGYPILLRKRVQESKKTDTKKNDDSLSSASGDAAL